MDIDEKKKTALWADEGELFELMKTQRYTPVVGDIRLLRPGFQRNDPGD